MPQRQVQTQSQRQVQRLSPQQLVYFRLLEMPVSALEEKINNEIVENVALEKVQPDENEDFNDNENDNYDESNDGYSDSVLFDQFDDNTPVHRSSASTPMAEIPIGEVKSFIDNLRVQISEYNVTTRQRRLILYLIGSLNDKGFLDTPLDRIADDLLIRHNFDTSPQELQEALKILQQFDPAGIGAANLQECLLIQLSRMEKNDITGIAKLIVYKYYDLFINGRHSKLAEHIHASQTDIDRAIDIISHLNPSPGMSLNESASDRVETVVPDVIIETTSDGEISFRINDAGAPNITIASDFLEQYETLQQLKQNKETRKAIKFTREHVRSARNFIEALNMRKQTITDVMKVIIAHQRQFILTQDKSTLRPMLLKDVAEQAGYDVSTISRVQSSKYCLLDQTVYPLSHFFVRTRKGSNGEAVVAIQVQDKIQQLIESEDPLHPYSDQEIEELLSAKGLTISRRTVAKYRKSLGYPIATRRRK